MATALSNLLALLALDESAYLKGLDSSQKATDSFGGNLAAVGGTLVVGALTAVGTAIVAVGGAAFDAAETVDEAYDSIAVSTGATGDELATLQDDFEQVFSSVPTDAQTAADATGILNSRLGWTGPVLQDTSKSLIEMTRLLGGDLKSNGEAFTRMVGDWGLNFEDLPVYMDEVFVASQKTGANLTTLMQQIVQYGAPMRNFGFSFEEAASLLASFTAQGVNTEIIMSGLRTAQGKFIAQGKDMKTGLWDTIDAIQNAATQTDALAIATEIFGAKAAGDMVDTIRAGKFDLDALVGSMKNADGAIMDAASSTADWGEKWKTFQNKMTIALAPIGEKLREGMGSALDSLVEIFERPDVQAAVTQFANFAVAGLGQLVDYIPVVIQGAMDFITFLQNNQGIVVAVFAALGVAAVAWGVVTAAAAWAAVSPFLPVIAVILLVAGAIYLLYEAWTNNWGGIQQKTATAIDWIKGAFQNLMDTLTAIWQNPVVQTVVQNTLENIKALFAAFKAAFNGDWVAFGENLRTIWDNHWNTLGTIVSAAWSFIQAAIANLISNAINMFKSTDWSAVGKNIVQGIINGLSSMIGAAVNASLSVANAIGGTITGFFKIHSPSGWGEDKGEFIGLGLIKGFENILTPLALQPALSDINLNVQATGSPVSAATPAQAGGDDALLEEIRRTLRSLPSDIARAVRDAVEKTVRE